MKASFKMKSPNKVTLVVSPDDGTEAMLLAMFLRFDQNVFAVTVERDNDSNLKAVTFHAAESD